MNSSTRDQKIEKIVEEIDARVNDLKSELTSRNNFKTDLRWKGKNIRPMTPNDLYNTLVELSSIKNTIDTVNNHLTDNGISISKFGNDIDSGVYPISDYIDDVTNLLKILLLKKEIDLLTKDKKEAMNYFSNDIKADKAIDTIIERLSIND